MDIGIATVYLQCLRVDNGVFLPQICYLGLGFCFTSKNGKH